MDSKYHYLSGTHCWFCDREFATSICIFVRCGSPLQKTKEHIIPKSKLGINDESNYIASCSDCNSFKRNLDAKGFAKEVTRLYGELSLGEHNLYKFFPTIIKRSWKLYNKTHKTHKASRLALTDHYRQKRIAKKQFLNFPKK